MANIEEQYLTDIAHKKDFLVSATGDLQVISGVENVRQALLRRLMTQPGALVHRPDYGVGIKDFQNAVNSIENQRRLALKIQEQFLRDFRVEKFVGMKVTQSDRVPGQITIYFKAELRGFGEVELTFKPFGETV